jgi:hypothetical protein
MREIDENVRIRALEIIRLLRNPPHLADEEVSAPLSELERILGCPYVSDMMFYESPELSDEEVITRALQYSPFVG